jgi:hypothetical protein
MRPARAFNPFVRRNTKCLLIFLVCCASTSQASEYNCRIISAGQVLTTLYTCSLDSSTLPTHDCTFVLPSTNITAFCDTDTLNQPPYKEVLSCGFYPNIGAAKAVSTYVKELASGKRTKDVPKGFLSTSTTFIRIIGQGVVVSIFDQSESTPTFIARCDPGQ